MALLRLARQLGLLETIFVEGAEPLNTIESDQHPHISMQQYDYLIAIDFEATCWKDQAPPKWRESEIIEFPAVLWNLKNGKAEAEFQKYLRPIEAPKLSEFCINFTGIKQHQVDNGIPLQTALTIFHEWLRNELRLRNLILPKMSKENESGNCAFITWTDCDFKNLLDKECRRKNISKPSYFNQFIDLQKIVKGYFNSSEVLNFDTALARAGLTFVGKRHSGLDDARNLARLAYKMVQAGVNLRITDDLMPAKSNTNF